MKILLISPYLDITSLSTRLLSSYLKAGGHSVVQVFLPDLQCMMEKGIDFIDCYPDEVVEQVATLADGFHLLGMSLMTNYFIKMTHLTRGIRKRIDIPVVWGGIHPTVAPEECMDIADYICVGEGEVALQELADNLQEGIRPAHVKNIWFRDEQGECRNPVREPISDLDEIPFPDYDIEDQYVLVGRKVLPLSEYILKEMVRGRVHFNEPHHYIYETMWTRGCPHHCAYCINNYYRTLYSGFEMVRRRSVDNLIEEIRSIRERFPWFNRINFMDDDFASASNGQLLHFRDRYKKEINCPFFSLLSVLSSGEEKLSILFDAGLRRTEIGIQSLSPSTNRLYRREYFSMEKLLKLAGTVKRVFPPEFCPTYDVILENPWESLDDVLLTLRGVLDLPRPFVLQLFSLTFFPGITLFQKAMEDGIISGSDASHLKEDHDRGFGYLNLLFVLVNKRVPNCIIRFLSWKPFVEVMESTPIKWFLSLFNPLYKVLKKRSICRSQRKRFGWFISEHSG
ncbi:MAG: cobalamin-dependent protein [Candidatus Aegiribacteria sp.]|nr:cobalamin-dependent protein [Candidatus Aegiribacteria sp.]